MLNSEVVAKIGKQSGTNANDVQLVIDGLIEVLKETVARKGDSVTIRGLGTFKRHKRLAAEQDINQVAKVNIQFISLLDLEDEGASVS